MQRTNLPPEKIFAVAFQVARFLFLTVLLAGGLMLARGQSALDGFDPNANGAINVVVVQLDGKILIGGEFTALSPNGGVAVTRTNIARLNSDGSLDTNFNPNASAVVSAIAVQVDGKILVGGSFTSIGGQARNGIARLDPATGAADSFNPNASGGFPPTTVNTIAVQADGRILAGGNFLNIGGQVRNRIARLDPVTAAADSFNPSPNGFTGVQKIIVQPDGKILVGGGFGTIGGQTRNCIARLDPATGAADSFNPNAENTVHAMALQPDGKVLIGGDFGSVGGMTTFIARLDPVTGAPEAAFNPGLNERVASIAVQSDGKILIGGFFTTVGGQTRNRIARLNSIGSADASFNPNADFFVRAIAVQSDGKILVGGEFNNVGGETRNRIARLETDGRPDRTLNPSILGAGSAVYATAVQPDGKILIAGSFQNVLGVLRNNIARLNKDGTLDMAFNPNADAAIYAVAVQADGKIWVGGVFSHLNGQTQMALSRLDAVTGLKDGFLVLANGPVFSITLQADGRILVGGTFTDINGPRNRIARFDPATGFPDSFDPNANGNVFSIATQPDGQILVGGDFTSIGGQPRNRMARLNATNGLADSFDPNASGAVHAIAVQADGKILAGGSFNGTNSIGGQTRNRIARLEPVAGAADSFNPNVSGSIVQSIVLQADGKILAGGDFTNVNGQARTNIARLDSTGLPDSFSPNANSLVFTIALPPDGKILVGGFFSFIGGTTRNRFARLSNDTAALQNLAVSQSAIIWMHGGSSSQLRRVTFESSTDNISYNFLGNGTAAGVNWTLTGLNLGTGTNIYIRARGYSRSGTYNGSESIQEYVLKAFLSPLPPQLNIQRSANTNVVLSWATNLTGFTLEAKTNLNTNVWSVVLPAPALSGTNNVVTNIISGPARFYRLSK